MMERAIWSCKSIAEITKSPKNIHTFHTENMPMYTHGRMDVFLGGRFESFCRKSGPIMQTFCRMTKHDSGKIQRNASV